MQAYPNRRYPRAPIISIDTDGTAQQPRPGVRVTIGDTDSDDHGRDSLFSLDRPGTGGVGSRAAC